MYAVFLFLGFISWEVYVTSPVSMKLLAKLVPAPTTATSPYQLFISLPTHSLSHKPLVTPLSPRNMQGGHGSVARLRAARLQLQDERVVSGPRLLTYKGWTVQFSPERNNPRLGTHRCR